MGSCLSQSAALEVGTCTAITCAAAGARIGQDAVVTERVFPGPIAQLDVYRVALADGSQMLITRNNLAIASGALVGDVDGAFVEDVG